jgi:hypothetical protein
MKDRRDFLGGSDHRFRRDTARDLLIFNPAVTDANEAFCLAQELIMLSYAWQDSVDGVELTKPEEPKEESAQPCAK